MWVSERLVDGGAVGTQTACIHMDGPLVVGAFRRALDEIVRRHEILRTSFVGDETPIQRIHDQLSIGVTVVDLRGLSEADREAATQRIVANATRRRFELERVPLIRATLLKLRDDKHLLLRSLHHILYDGLSEAVFCNELSALYAAYLRGSDSPLPALPIQYADYAIWQREWIRSPEVQEHLAYWKERLSGPLPPVMLPQDRRPAARQSFEGDTHPIRLPLGLYRALELLGRSERVTPFMTLLAAFKALLHRLSGQCDIIVGSPAANRNRAELQPLIGCFMQPLVLRTNLSGNPSFRVLLQRMRQTCLGAYAHRDAPFELVARSVTSQSHMDPSQLFQVVFNLLHQETATLDLEGLTGTTWELASHSSALSLSVHLWAGDDGVDGSIEYATELFDASTIAWLVEGYCDLLRQVVADPERPLSELGVSSTVRGTSQSRETEPVADPRRELRDLLLQQATGMNPDRTIEPQPRDGRPLPASFGQERLWLSEHLHPGTALFNESYGLAFKGPLDVDALRSALCGIVHRHETLRTRLVRDGDTLTQVIDPPTDLSLPIIDLSDTPAPWHSTEIRRLEEERVNRPFDLARGPLILFTLVKLSTRHHVLLVVVHHAVIDGLAMAVFRRDLGSLYRACRVGAPSPLPALPIQYADFAAWQRNTFQGPRLHEEIAYWRPRLPDRPPRLELPFDRIAGPDVAEHRGAAESFAVPEAVRNGLKQLSAQEGVTLFMTLLTAFKALLFRYTGQPDVIVDTPIGGRRQPELKELIGFFVNSLALRTSLFGAPTFRDLLARVRETCLGAYQHQDLPFDRIVREMLSDRSGDQHHFTVASFMLHPAVDETEQWDALQVVPLPLTPRDNFDLSLYMWGGADTLTGTLKYNAALFAPATILRIITHYQAILEAAIADPTQRITRLPMLSARERWQLLVGWNDTEREVSSLCVHQAFEAQVERTPNQVAVVCGSASLTYRELNARANQLAHRLRALGVGPEVLVGICVDRSFEMVVGLLGVLKAGGGYVPLDPGHPPERLGLMLADTRASLVLTQEHVRSKLSQLVAKTVSLDGKDDEMAGESQQNPAALSTHDHVAYVIYTSGSTGKPKGVMIRHGSLANYTEAARRTFDLQTSDRVLQFASISFDAAAEEIYPCLTRGATLVLRNQEMLHSVRDFLHTCREWALTVLDLPTAFWHEVAHQLDDTDLPESLRLVIIGGERALPDRVARWHRRAHPRIRLLNTYGPTESTIVVAAEELTATSSLEQGRREVPIGRPVSNTQLYVLDPCMNPVPIGVRGEIWAGGVCLSRGYLNRPGLTAAQFVPDPFSSDPGSRLYRTGDLGRVLAEGTIECLGRDDRQAKLRGFRIELGEVEVTLNQHPAVRQSVAMIREDTPGDQRLVSYLVADAPRSVETEETALAHTHVAQWEAVFNDLYHEYDDRLEMSFYVKGWDSNYTGEPIPDAEVKQWMDQTVDRIQGLHPGKVLELGCGGSGLMLQRIAPGCRHYCATDVSQNALRVLGKQLEQLDVGCAEIALIHRAADDFTGVAPDSFDTVLIVSVAQYFSNVEYLLKVLDGAFRVVEPGGNIFLGDVRSLPLLKAFHTSVQLYRAADDLSLEQLAQRVQTQLLGDRQLAIDPAFFVALKQRFPNLAQVEVLLERGGAQNELGKFRYDVILQLASVDETIHTDESAAGDVPWVDWDEAGLAMGDIPRMLADAPDGLGIRGVPNARVMQDVRALQWLEASHGLMTAGELRKALSQDDLPGADPDQFWALAEELGGHAADITWSGSRPDGRFDVLFRGPTSNPLGRLPVGAPLANQRPWQDFTNDPLRAETTQNLAPRLRRFLATRLPEYMVPSAFVFLDLLPLTSSGKVDRAALPAPEGHRQLDETFVAPRNDMEAQVAGIWAEVLGVDNVGVHDNFFDLGGHSLLMLQLHRRLHQAFHQDIPLVELFRLTTVHDQAQRLSGGSQPEDTLRHVRDRVQKQRMSLRKTKQAAGAVRRRQRNRSDHG